MTPDQINLSTLAKHFSDDEAAWLLVEEMRWPNGPICPHCGTVNDAHLIKSAGRKTRHGALTFRREWRCASCKKQFSVLVGTIFHGSHVPLPKWLLAVHMMTSCKNGVAALELQRNLGVTYKTAWFICHRVRLAMDEGAFGHELMTGEVQVDETYVGGHLRNMPTKKRRAADPWANKTAVVTLISDSGKARSQRVERVDGNNLGIILAQNVDQSATLMTDEGKHYRLVAPLFHAHETVNHSEHEYARRDGVTTNRVEGFFSQLKRGIDGTHHHVSKQHLSRYLAEYDFRYNHREISDGARTVQAIRKSAGKRLKYRDATR